MNGPIRTVTRTATCKRCGGDLELTGRLMIGEVFDCASCRAPVEVANLEPLVLVPFAKIEEDAEDFEGLDWP